MLPRTCLCTIALAAGLARGGLTPERMVQYRSVDFVNKVFEIHNFGDTEINLDGWRICTHNFATTLNYSRPLDGMVIGPGGSIYVHMNDDAPPGADHINRVDFAPIALPFEPRPYALELFWPNGGTLIFSSLEDMVDHVQWSIDGRDSNNADERSQQAVNAGLWTDDEAWIATTARSLGWMLIPEGGLLHGPDDYTVFEPPNCNEADLAEPFNVLDNADISAFVALFLANDPSADIDGDGLYALPDIVGFLGAYIAGCP